MINHLRLTVTVLLAIALAFAPAAAHALGLGQIQVKSQRDQPLLAEIPVISNDPTELQNLQARLASPATFARIGLAPPEGIVSNLQFSVALDASGRPVIRVTSPQPVSQALLTFLVEVDWGQGRLVREYSALLDTPQTAAAPVQPPIDEAVSSAPSAVIRAPQATDDPLAATAPVGIPLGEGTATPTPLPAADPLAATAPVPIPLTPEPEPVPSGPQPIATAAPVEVSEQTRTVRPGETLGSIARELDLASSLDQTMVALLRANPEAFIGGNANRVRAGAVLRVPTRDAIAGFNPDEAALVMREQLAQWRGNRRALPQPPAVAGSGTVARGEPAPARGATAVPTPRRSGEARLQIVPAAAAATASGTRSGTSAGGEGTMQQQQELLATRENLAAREAEVEELKARVAELEKLKNQQQALIALKDNELAAAQNRLDGSKGATPQTPAQANDGLGMTIAIGLGVLLLLALTVILVRRRGTPAPTAPRDPSRTERLAAAVPAIDPLQDEEELPAWSREAPATPPPPAAAAASAEPLGPAPTWHAGDGTVNPLNAAPGGQSRIELARAYYAAGDHDTARSLLREVIARGDSQATRAEAARLLDSWF